MGVSKKKKQEKEEPEIGWFVAVLTYYAYAVFVLIGHIRDLCGFITQRSRYHKKKEKPGYASLFNSWESFFTRRMYSRIQDCWNRPICSNPGAKISVMERCSKDANYSLQTTGKSIECLNLGSYNYLGFGDDWKATCRDAVVTSLEKIPISMCSSRMDFGSHAIHEELEQKVAKFVSKEAALVYSMGYGTNTSTIATLVGQGCLIISDQLNHTSIVNGARASPALIRVFRNNDAAHLDEILQEAVVNGQPKHHRPWKKIMVIVEGIYSMEGIICNLKEIVEVCKKYKAFIYVDEAHSIGALGKTGRGVCEYCGVDPADIDVLMGTFTKSFSGMGGYIAASKRIIDHIRTTAPGMLFHNSMSPIVCRQIIRAFEVISGEDGTNVGKEKLASLNRNGNYFREEMIKLGLHVYGDYDSPVIPILIYHPMKISAFSRECLKRGLAVVVVGFPATSVIYSRARVCVSAGHTEEDLKHAVKVISEVTDLLCMRYNNSFIGI